MSIFGAIDTSVSDFWWCLLWVSKSELAIILEFGRGVYVYIPSDSPLVGHFWQYVWLA